MRGETGMTEKGPGRAMLRGLLVDVGLPVVTYYVLHACGASDWVALLCATGVAALRLVVGIVRQRSVNQFALVMLVIYGIGLALALTTGDPRVLLLKSSLVTGAVGLVFLATAIHGKRPLTLSAMQGMNPAEAAGAAEAFRTNPRVRRSFRVTSSVWGIGLIAEALLRLPLVYLLPIDVGYGLSEALLVAAFVLLGCWTVWYVRRVRGAEG